MVSRLSERYPDKYTYTQKIQRFHTYLQLIGQNVPDYADEKCRRFRLAYPDQPVDSGILLQGMVAGLLEPLRLEVNRQKVTDFVRAREVALDYERALLDTYGYVCQPNRSNQPRQADGHGRPANRTNTPAPTNPSTSGPSHLLRKPWKACTQEERKTLLQHWAVTAKPAGLFPYSACTRCVGDGKQHLKAFCPEFTCGQCHKRGHHVAECGELDEQLRVVKLITTASGHHDEVTLTATLDGRPMTFELDSGAPVSILSVRDAGTLQLQPYTGGRVTSATGHALDVKGVTTTTLKLADREFRVRFLVTADETIPLLGRDFHRDHRLVVSYTSERPTITFTAEENLTTDADGWPADPDEDFHDRHLAHLSYEEAQEAGDAEQPLKCEVGSSALTKRQLAEARELVATAPFAHDPTKPGVYDGPAFTIDTGNAAPIRCQPRRATPAKELELAKHITKMLANEIIEEASSPWASPVVLARKKDGQYRFCVDYRALNAVTTKDAFPIPHVQDMFDALSKGRVFSTLDVASGFWHILIDERDRPKTAFTTNSGTYQFRVLPFGLCNAPAAFCRAMTECLRDLLWKSVLVFVDDIIIFSEDFQSHRQHLLQVFDRLRKAGFLLRAEKCRFFADTVDYLGHRISHQSVAVSPTKVAAIVSYGEPRSLAEVQRFLGMAGYYRRFIPKFATIAAPLFAATADFRSPNEAQLAAIRQLKEALVSHPVMRLPDFSKPFVLITDASGVGTGATLAQRHDDFEHPVHYASKAINPAQQAKHSYYKETLALVRGLKQFDHYLRHARFTVATDCRALSFFNTKKELPADVERHLSLISSYDIVFEHRAGTSIAATDALSRDPRFAEMERHRQLPLDAREMGDDSTRFRFRMQQPQHTVRHLAEEQQPLPGIADASSHLLKYQCEHRPTQQQMRFLAGNASDFEPETLERLRKETKKLVLRDGHLFRKPTASHPHPRPVVPPALRETILRALHDDPMAGHGGVDRTLQRVASRFWWTGMEKEISDYVRRCGCHLNKHPGPSLHAPLQPVPIGRPFESWALDHIDMPPSKRGHHHLLVMEDRFTKMIEIAPTTTKAMNEVAIAFEERVLCRWGTPDSVMADNAFKGEFATLCDDHGIEVHHCLPYRHVGLVERMNRTIEECLRNYASPSDADWDEYLPRVQFAINTSRAASHGFTPVFVATGREPVLSIQRRLFRKSEPENHNDPAPEDVARVEQLAAEKMVANQDKMAAYHDKKFASKTALAVGQWVSLGRPEKGKLENQRIGPFRIAAIATDRPTVTLRFADLPGTDWVAHSDDLLPWRALDGSETLPQMRFEEPKEKSAAIASRIRMIRKRFALSESDPIVLTHLIGQRIAVKFPQWKKLELGKVVAYEGKGRFWVDYDEVKDAEGSSLFLPNLLCGRPPQWMYADEYLALTAPEK